MTGILAILAPALWLGADELALEPGFVRLDNGKDLSGWIDKAGNWSVVDGALHLDAAKTPRGGNLVSEKTHSRHCVVRLQFRASHGADSGVFLHGAQFQVRDYPNSYPDTRRYAPFAKPAGQWNDLEFDITDGIAVVKLNGHVIEQRWPIGDQPAMGIGLQKEKGDFDYRFIRVKEKR
ncbi:MAG: DUF1080 domain-containing protein [Thermoguttaceae bacterium]|jgi:hypothetical protein|nr:DUF1080 domain-containing protein [Thermoguttaceae bacterium]